MGRLNTTFVVSAEKGSDRRFSRSVGCGRRSTLTVGEYLTQWLTHAKANVAPQTYRRYRQIVEGDLVPDLGRIRLTDLSALQVQGFLARSLGRKCKNRERTLSPQTVLHYHRLLRRALHQAVRWQLLAKNPCDLVDPPRAQHVEMTALGEKQLVSLLTAIRHSRLYAPTLLAATSGLRRGEILGLRWSEVDLDTGRMQVVRSLQETPNGLSFKTPKTRKGRRVVLVPKLAISALKAQRARQSEERLMMGPGYQDQDLVFARADGSPWPLAQFSSEFARLMRKHGFAVRFHDLRHTHASQLLRHGVPVRVVSERLGHATASITLDVYAHILPGQQEEAAAKIDAALGAAAGE